MCVCRYVFSEHQSVLNIPREAVLEGRIQWGEVPWGKGASSTSRKEVGTVEKSAKLSTSVDSTVDSTELIGGEWKEAMSAGGQTYYWNTVTRETTWVKPKEMKS